MRKFAALVLIGVVLGAALPALVGTSASEAALHPLTDTSARECSNASANGTPADTGNPPGQIGNPAVANGGPLETNDPPHPWAPAVNVGSGDSGVARCPEGIA
jgi:hypothetical protein